MLHYNAQCTEDHSWKSRSQCDNGAQRRCTGRHDRWSSNAAWWRWTPAGGQFTLRHLHILFENWNRTLRYKIHIFNKTLTWKWQIQHILRHICWWINYAGCQRSSSSQCCPGPRADTSLTTFSCCRSRFSVKSIGPSLRNRQPWEVHAANLRINKKHDVKKIAKQI